MNIDKTPDQIQKIISEIDQKIGNYLLEIKKCLSIRNELAAKKMEATVKELIPDFGFMKSATQKESINVNKALENIKTNNKLYDHLMHPNEKEEKQPVKKRNEMSLKNVIMSIFNKPISEIRKKIPNIPSNATGLKVVDIKLFIEKEHLYNSSLQNITAQISSHVSVLKREGKILRLPDRRYIKAE